MFARLAIGLFLGAIATGSADSAWAGSAWTAVDTRAKQLQSEQMKTWDSEQTLNLTGGRQASLNCKSWTSQPAPAGGFTSGDEEMNAACAVLKMKLPCVGWTGQRNRDSAKCINSDTELKSSYSAYKASREATPAAGEPAATEEPNPADADSDDTGEAVEDANDALAVGTDADTRTYKQKKADLKKSYKDSLKGKTGAEKKKLRAQYKKDKAKLKADRKAEKTAAKAAKSGGAATESTAEAAGAATTSKDLKAGYKDYKNQIKADSTLSEAQKKEKLSLYKQGIKDAKTAEKAAKKGNGGFLGFGNKKKDDTIAVAGAVVADGATAPVSGTTNSGLSTGAKAGVAAGTTAAVAASVAIGVNAHQAKGKSDYKCPSGPFSKVKHKFLGGKKASAYYCKAKVSSKSECDKYGGKAKKVFLGKKYICKVPAIAKDGSGSSTVDDTDDDEDAE